MRVALALVAALQVSASACDQKPVATQEPVVVEHPRATPRPPATPESTATPQPLAFPVPTSTPSPTATQIPVPTATATPTNTSVIPSPTATQIPAPTATATPTNTPVPTASVEPDTPSVPVREASPVVQEHELAIVVRGNTVFALDLYRTLAEVEGNFFYSPSSISMALAMTYAGARGETERQMAETLQYHLPQDRLHASFNVLDLSLRAQGARSDGAELRVVNAVWAQDGRAFLESYLDTVTRHYSGGIRRVDFRGMPEGARNSINEWVAAETEDRIKDLIAANAITPSTRLVLANAIYFNAGWQQPFAERATTRQAFSNLDGGESLVPLMRQIARFGYVRGDGFQAVELSYDGGELFMTVLLPDEGRFREFERALDAALLSRVRQDIENRLVRLAMPRFDLGASLNLANTLKEMGMVNAFDDQQAEFQGIDGLSCLAGDDGCLLISHVVHKAFISVDESGIEAAAATAVAVGITRAVAPAEEPIELTIDRPFVFLIQDRATHSVLFIGRIAEL